MVLPEVPGIIEAALEISSEPDGKLSFRVIVGADDGRSPGFDLVELIIGPEHLRRALAAIRVRDMTDPEDADQPATLPCHIGLYRGAVHSAA